MAIAASSRIREADRSRQTAMPGRGWVRVSALAGPVFFVLMVVYANLRNGAPAATDSGQKVIDYVTTHQSDLQLGAALLGLAMAAALVWLPGLYDTLRRAEGAHSGLGLGALAGGALAAAGSATTALLQGTIAVRIADLSAADARVWWTMYLLSTGIIALGLLVVIGVTAIVALQRHLFARWFRVVCVALAIMSAVGVATLGYADTGVQVVAGIAVILDSVWILLASIFVWRGPGRELRIVTQE